MEEYQKKGYLIQEFKVFRLSSALESPVPFHYHDFHKIILFLKGQGGYIIEGKTYPLLPRDIIFVSAGEIHRPDIPPQSDYERIVIYIAPDFLARYQRNGENLAACWQTARLTSSVMHVPPGKSHDLLYHMEKLEKNAHLQGFANGLYTEILFIEFMILLNRALLERELEDDHAAAFDPKIQPLLNYINEHLCEELTIEHLAETAYLSRFYLMRRFKAATGYSIHQYITSKRLLLARSRLASGLPVTQICYECGFKDYSSFSRAFKERFHISPKDYRKNL